MSDPSEFKSTTSDSGESNLTSSSSPVAAETGESFKDLLSQYERSHARRADDGSKQLEGTVAAITADRL